jgi:hypothetical protein
VGLALLFVFGCSDWTWSHLSREDSRSLSSLSYYGLKCAVGGGDRSDGFRTIRKRGQWPDFRY